MKTRKVDALFLCADWCVVCKGLKPTFQELQASSSDIHWQWVDVEDYSEIFDQFDIENFPSLLIMVDETPWFLGSTDPRKDVIARTAEAVANSPQSMLSEPMNDDVVQMLRSQLLA